jgi:FkbM family methyltransferase
MANVFLDLGTHFGQGLDHFIGTFGINDTWTVHTFEANPITHKIYKEHHHSKHPFVISHNEAILDRDGVIDINIETPPNEGHTGQGSSVIGMDKWNPWGGTLRENFQFKVEVPCVDLSKFIIDNFSKEDRIIIKMDIEGAEFDTLSKIVESGVVEYIDELYVEWHDHYFTNKEEMLEKKKILVDNMSKYNIKLVDWH